VNDKLKIILRETSQPYPGNNTAFLWRNCGNPQNTSSVQLVSVLRCEPRNSRVQSLKFTATPSSSVTLFDFRP